MHVNKEMALLNAALCPQVFTLLTVTLPATVPQVLVILVVPCPAVMVAPVGTVHNCVTPVTAGVVKVTPTWFGHTEATLVILAGVAGKRVSDALRVDVPPQALTAVTERVPVVNVLGTLITIELPLLVTIEQPAGTVQL
jgi:hypothetical protein